MTDSSGSAVASLLVADLAVVEHVLGRADITCEKRTELSIASTRFVESHAIDNLF